MRRFAFLLSSLCLCLSLAAQTPPAKTTDFNAILKEVMKVQITQHQQSMAFWMPYEFFLAAGQMGGGDVEAFEKEASTLKHFAIIAVQIGRDEEDGLKQFLSEEELKRISTLKLNSGKPIKAVPMSTLSSKMASMIGILKASMAREGGSDNMHVLVFPVKDAGGKPLLNATQAGLLKLDLPLPSPYQGLSFSWRMPLDSLSEPRACVGCSEPLTASWRFCPYCGKGAPKN